MNDDPEAQGWRPLADYGSLSAAEVDAAYLRSEGLAARVWNVAALPTDAGGYRVVVEAQELEKARWLLKFPPVGEAELEALATGKLPEASGPDETAGS
ncbi:MAG: hypothetical protein U0P81_15575 [Holophagaceae bacterium]